MLHNVKVEPARGAGKACLPGVALLGRLEFGVQLSDESVSAPLYRRNLGIEIGCRMSGDDLFGRLALLDKLLHAIPNSENHIPVGHHGGSINTGAVTRNNFRI